MSVEVRIPTVFRKFTSGEAAVELEPGTVGDLIAQLDRRYPGFQTQVLSEGGELHRFVNVYVNDEDIRYLGRLEATLEPGDTVSILPAVAGGC
ncbi:MAG: MoaD family protein [Actinomycetota bacterium]